jgi:hypothetical protein
MATQIPTQQLQITSTKQDLITNRTASNNQQVALYSTSGGGTGVCPTYLPTTTNPHVTGTGCNTAIITSHTQNTLNGTAPKSGGRYRRKTKRRKTKRSKRKKSRRRNKL